MHRIVALWTSLRIVLAWFQTGTCEVFVTLPSRAKAAQYRKALAVGAFLFLFQFIVLFFLVFSRALGADTLHGFLDVLTLAGTTYLFSRTWSSEQEFRRKERAWLTVGVWSLALGGIFVGTEAVLHLLSNQGGSVPPAWPLLVVALVGAMGNLWMHRILDSVPHGEHGHLHKNNLDHVLWDGVLSGAVFISGCSMWIWGTNAIDSWIAIIVGFGVLPYFARKRWKDGTRVATHDAELKEAHDHEHHHHDH